MMLFEVGSKQIQGARDYQEDDYVVVMPGLSDTATNNITLAVIADGMGGHAGGAVASEIVVNTFTNHFVDRYTDSADIPALLRDSLFESNQQILRTITQRHELNGMGCTLIAVLLIDNLIYWISVGDSHLYLLRGDNVFKLNEDHSYGGFIDRLTAAGEKVPETPGFNPRRNMLMSYVNGEQIAMIDQPDQPLKISSGDRFLLATDGLDTLSEEFFLEISQDCEDAQTLANNLIDSVEVLKKRNQDNTTVIALHCEGDEPDAEALIEESYSGADNDDRGSVLSELDTIVDAERPNVIQVTTHRPNSEQDRQSSNINEYLSEIADEDNGDEADEYMDPIDDDDLPEGDEFLAKSATDQTNELDAIAPATSEFSYTDNEQPEPRPRKSKILPTTTLVLATAAVALYLLRPDIETWPFIGEQANAPATTAIEDSPEPATKNPTTMEQPRAPKPVPPTTLAGKAVKAQPPKLKQYRDVLPGGQQGPLLIQLPATNYSMGRPDSAPHYDERPQREVSIPAFMISQHETTFDDFDMFTDATNKPRINDKGWGRGKRPVIHVSWQDAVDYTIWLSNQTRAKYRLPSEAEWEYAASGNQSSLYWWGYKIGHNNANCWGCGSPFDAIKTAPIGNFKPNPFGLFDTAGNVLEWVLDCHHVNYKNAPNDHQPWLLGGDCSRRIVRGGSFTNPPDNLRTTKRAAVAFDEKRDNIGFRIVREIQ